MSECVHTHGQTPMPPKLSLPSPTVPSVPLPPWNAVPTPVQNMRLSVNAAPSLPQTGGGAYGAVGTDAMTALKASIDNLVGSKVATVGANAPITGTPPTGITIQAQGPNVVVNQAPPNVNVAVSVNVLNPDEAPAATATAVGQAIGQQVHATMSDTMS